MSARKKRFKVAVAIYAHKYIEAESADDASNKVFINLWNTMVGVLGLYGYFLGDMEITDTKEDNKS